MSLQGRGNFPRSNYSAADDHYVGITPTFLVYLIVVVVVVVAAAAAAVVVVAECPKLTRGSAIAEEPRDALCQLKYYDRFFD